MEQVHVTYDELTKGIANAMATINSVKRVEANDQIAEAVQETPKLEIWAESGEADRFADATSQFSFNKGVKASRLTVKIDGYAKQRSNLGEDIRAQMNLIDAIDSKLTYQSAPFFGMQGIKAYKWQWERVTFQKGEVTYAGVQFTVDITVF